MAAIDLAEVVSKASAVLTADGFEVKSNVALTDAGKIRAERDGEVVEVTYAVGRGVRT